MTTPGGIDPTPSLKGVRAAITTKWSSGGYSPRTVRSIVSYYVDTSLDNDADTWTIEIADPGLSMPEILARDNEVRVQLYGAGANGTGYLFTGITDDVEYNESGVMRLVGRDLSILAIDNIAPPALFRHVRASALIHDEATKLGFPRTALNATSPVSGKTMVKKVMKRDGSETYWEFWYRLYRNEKMWLWTDPDGTLIGDRLNYDSPPSYYFGIARANESDAVKRMYIPCTSTNFKKSTTTRAYEVAVHGHKGDKGFIEKAYDQTLSGWQLKRRKLIDDPDAHSWDAASKSAYEEIFEGKVGAIEYNLTIIDPGFTIRTNKIARLNLPDIGLAGDFYVVGNRIQAGPEGVIQEVRLREKNYAITRRIPDEPSAKTTSAPTGGAAGVAQQIQATGDVPKDWADYFVKAANKWHGPWDFNTFLALLLAIAEQETGIHNIRENGGPGGSHIPWYPRPRSENDPGGAALARWLPLFLNETKSVGREYGVGPMQLTDPGLKYEADDMMKTGYHDEREAGRWHPEHNIMTGAHYLRTCLDALADPRYPDTMWKGVAAYNAGVRGWSNGIGYADKVKALLPKYLQEVETARAEAAKSGGGVDTSGPEWGFVNSTAQIAKLTWLKPATSNVDLIHVDFELLSRLNNLGKASGKVIIITSGFRTDKEQLDAYNRGQAGQGGKAANPKKKPSNHQLGEACDCVVLNNIPVGDYYSKVQLYKYGLHASVKELWEQGFWPEPDAVHITKLGVTG